MSALKQVHFPKTPEEAARLLARGDGVRCLAGGASLVAMMNLDLVDPDELVSLAEVAELKGIASLPDGGLRIGAMTRHRELETEARLAGPFAVLREAAGKVANPPVRNMGTIGGVVALADPAADYPSALVAADAVIELASERGRRRVPAREFFVGLYATALAPAEIVSAILLPPAAAGVGLYDKLARVAGDHAIVSVALAVTRRPRGDLGVGLAIGGCGLTPVHRAEADVLLAAGALGDAAARRAGELLAAAADPLNDVRASADYRRLAIPRMVTRAVARAREELGRLG
ncbi:MAG: xanthine dehydrogenase family protein subunit M [Burkholderiales bacterium]|nr:xanthine dehydrogenase family protein subunit M [Burkholderiales bacterium]